MITRILFCVCTLTYVVHVACLTEQQVYTYMTKAFYYAQREHERQNFIDKHYLTAGIDDKEGKTSRGTATSMFQLSDIFRYMMNSTFGQADHCFVGLLATQELSKMLKLPFATLKANPLIANTYKTIFSNICTKRQPTCTHSRYRTYDGSCNNLQHPAWGMSNRPQKRYLPPIYGDGISKPRTTDVYGKPLPSARVISNVIHETPIMDMKDEGGNNVLVMQFGQLLDHDLSDTPMLKGAQKADIECCKIKPHEAEQRHACFTIPIPPNDGQFRTSCMNFVRSTPGTGDDCSMGIRDQVNQFTSYLDANFLYGSDDKNARQVRTFVGGKLVMDERGLFGVHEDDRNCMKKRHGDYCMKSGDRKIHVVPTLTSISVVFLREHNLIATLLSRTNPHWEDEMLYQETRKIMMAINQQIVYTEYLPIILGQATMAKYHLDIQKTGFNTVYDPSVDASVANVFAVAAFRFGHSQVPGIVGLIDEHRKRMDVNLEDTYNKPATALTMNGKGCEWINRWMGQEKGGKTDRFLEKAVKDELFLDDDGDSFDLSALNIQRGRDHGTPGYNTWRHWCGLSTALNFQSGYGGLVDIEPTTAHKLSHVYGHPDDIDIFTGGLAETLLPGAKVGPTFACILGQQFKDLKFGDRFWYENNYPDTGFTEAQLNSIKRIRFSRLMCDSSSDQYLQEDVFNIPSPSNPLVHCDTIPGLDLRLWQDTTYSGPNYGHQSVNNGQYPFKG